MNNKKNLNSLKKSFNLYHNGEFFAKFEYDKELKRYQSDCGYLTVEKVYELANDMEEERKIKWI